jgi:RNA polymerase sigma factor (sigma-70 family)
MRGDREAFSSLFRRHYPLLYQYGQKICRESEVLEDAIQELFIEIWQKKPSRPVHSVKAYLIQAVKFKLYKHFRGNKPVTSLEEQDQEPFELSHETLLIEEQSRNELNRQVLEALDKLPPRQKEVIYLKIYKGLDYDEVSAVMNLNYQVVRNLLCQALKSFRSSFEEK